MRSLLSLLTLTLLQGATALVASADDPAKEAFIRGYVKQQRGDLDGALADYTRAIEIDPRHASAYYGRGFVKNKKGDLDGALADYTRAIEINPRDANAYNNRGVVKNKKGDLDGALADYTRAIEIDPRHAIAYNNRGIVKWSSRDFAGAASDFRVALKLDPLRDYTRFFLFLAQALASDGETVAAAALNANLATRGKPIESESWMETLDGFLRGKTSFKHMVKVAQATPEADRAGNLCQAYFYGGMVEWIRGDKVRARVHLEQCIATNMINSREHGAARAVLGWPE